MPGTDYKQGGGLPFDGEELTGFILDHVPNLVFVKDAEFRIVYANQAFREIYAPEDRGSLLGTTTVEKFSEKEADLFLAEDRRALEQGHSEIVETIVDWRGHKRVLLTRKFAINKPAGEKLLVAIATDISKLSAREKRLVRLNAQLKIYSHTIAHDLKNPMASIISGLNIIGRDSDNLSERSNMVLKSVRDSAGNLSGYISSMLKAAAAESEELEFESYDLNILMEEVRFNLSASIAGADMQLHIARLPDASVEPNLLRQLFQNLIENAIKHARAEGLVVRIHYEQDENDHIFYVTDNGCGIPDERKETVFSQFFKDGAQDGLGLGLTTSQRIANLHDGFIEIRDTEAGGCCFVVHISRALERKEMLAPSL